MPVFYNYPFYFIFCYYLSLYSLTFILEKPEAFGFRGQKRHDKVSSGCTGSMNKVYSQPSFSIFSKAATE
ncbi:hypothetical protein MSMTP_1003 [Methanosarcina sp. MTP4]|nr:hypothetical protein MSMTP_1003 [Methanosarcina sp. MTP4]